MTRRSKAEDIKRNSNVEAIGVEPQFPDRVNVPSKKKGTRVFWLNFSDISELGNIVNPIKKEFLAYTEHLSPNSTKAVFISVRHYFKYCIAQGFTMANKNSNWTYALHSWKGHLVTQRLADITVNSYISSCSGFLRHLAKRGIIELTSAPSPIPNTKSKQKSPVGLLALDSNKITDGLSVVNAGRLEELKSFESNATPDNILKKNQLLLDILREYLVEKAVKYYVDIVDFRNAVYSSSGFDIQKFKDEFQISKNPLKFRRGWREVVDSDVAIAKLLLDECGVRLSSGSKNSPIMAHAYENFSIHTLANKFYSTYDNIWPFIGLFVLELRNEVSSTQNMSKSSVNLSGDDDYSVAIYLKARAKSYKTVVKGAANNIEFRKNNINIQSIFKAVSYIREPIEEYAHPDDKDNLFLVWPLDGKDRQPRSIDAGTWTRVWRRHLDDHPILRLFHINLDMIRASLAMQVFGARGDALDVERTLKHDNSDTSIKYNNNAFAEMTTSIDIRTSTHKLRHQILVATSFTAAR